jgi:SLOG cluster4 family
MRMKVLITGSRQATPAILAKVEEVVLWVKRQGYALLVGDAPGVDAHVRVCAEALSVPTTVYGAYCRLRGRRRSHEQVVVVLEAYAVRDRLMVQACDLCVAVWNGRSRGTSATFEFARRLGKHVVVRTFDAAGGRWEAGAGRQGRRCSSTRGRTRRWWAEGVGTRVASDPELSCCRSRSLLSSLS